MRGFTLVEMMVAIAAAITVTAAALGVYLSTRTMGIEISAKNQMARDLQLALDIIERDLSFAGAGMPYLNKETATDTCSFTATGRFVPHFRVAADTAFAFVGDLPYPNAEFNGVMTFVDGNNGDDRLTFMSEVSGNCAPNKSGGDIPYMCDTRQTTLIPGLVLTGDNNCQDGAMTERTCPWAMNKWQNADASSFQPFILVTPRGQWVLRGADVPMVDPANSGNMATWGNYAGFHTHSVGTCGDADIDEDTMHNPYGGAWAATPDRVFYRRTGTAGAYALERRQCWGDIIDPDDPEFPEEEGVGGAATIGELAFPISAANWTTSQCDDTTTPKESTGWEQIVDGLDSVSFDYFGTDFGVALTTEPLGCRNNDYGDPMEFDPDSSIAGAPACILGQVRAVHVTLTATRTMPVTAKTFSQTAQRRIFLINRARF
jgi:prepilin-type N-terminal cleavage/methylation domain-containing protein